MKHLESGQDGSCTNCTHWHVCAMAQRFTGTIKRYGKKLKAVEGGYSEPIYKAIASVCFHHANEALKKP